MRKSAVAICTAIMMSLIYSAGIGEATTKKPAHHIGLHDRLLTIEDIRVIDGDMKVPLTEIAKALYMTMHKEDSLITIRKHGVEITYNNTTKQTAKDSTEVSQSPILNNNTLIKYEVQGTFFFLGKYMKNNKEIVQTVADAGHYIGTHSMTHDKKEVYKSSKTFISEMNDGLALISQMTGRDANLIRVPYGSKPHVTPAMQKQLTQNGYKMWDWDVDSIDWKYTDKQAAEIVKNVRTGVQKAYKSGDRDIIILLHDRSQTTIALPQIIEWLQKEGYTIKPYKTEHHIIQNFLHDTTL